MPQLTPSTVSILPPTQSSGGATKQHANNLRYGTNKSDDAAFWSTASDALGSLQNQVDDIVNALRKELPQPEVIQVVDPSGALIAQIGNIVGSDNVAYPGIWARDLYVGGEGPDTAIIIANNDGVQINGATITLNDNGTLTTISNETNPWSGNAASLTSEDIASGYYSEIDPFHMALLAPGNTPISRMDVIIISGVAYGDIVLGGGTHSIQLSAFGPAITVSDGSNTSSIAPLAVDSPGYFVNGVPGINLTETFVTSLSVSIGSAITSVDFGGSTTTSGSFVTAVTVTGTVTHDWQSGLLIS